MREPVASSLSTGFGKHESGVGTQIWTCATEIWRAFACVQLFLKQVDVNRFGVWDIFATLTNSTTWNTIEHA